MTDLLQNKNVRALLAGLATYYVLQTFNTRVPIVGPMVYNSDGSLKMKNVCPLSLGLLVAAGSYYMSQREGYGGSMMGY